MIQNTPSVDHVRQVVYDNRNLFTLTAEDILCELNIDAAARHILSTIPPSQERREALTALLDKRASLMHHVAVNGLTGSVFFCNMKQIGLAPTPNCPAYKKMRLPTISDYYRIGSNIGNILLCSNALQYIPSHILERLGDLTGKQVECFWTAVDGRPFAKMDGPINLCTHPWSHPHALVEYDVNEDVHMGVFPEIGFQSSGKEGAVAFDNVRPMQVHTHPQGNTALYSPNNAHFETIPGSPFGVLWAVTQKGDRVAITKMCVIFDYAHPISKILCESTRNLQNLEAHFEELKKIPNATHQTFNKLVALLEQNDPAAMGAFHALPPAFQYGIYQEAWVLFNSPQGIHEYFGGASFENASNLATEFHCTPAQRAEATLQFVIRLNRLLFCDQVDLMLYSQELKKGDNVVRMMQCALLFKEGKTNAAMEAFHQFSEDEQNAVRFAMWEICRCPRISSEDFGTVVMLSPKVGSDIKAEAVILAASRQVPSFEDEEQPLFVDKIPATPTATAASGQTSSFEGQLPFIEEIPFIAEIPAIPTGPLEEPVIIFTPNTLTPAGVYEALTNLAFDAEFLNQSPQERKSAITALFDQLPQGIKNAIYGTIYDYSTDANKGGDGWGEFHFADDLNTLINALHDNLG